jgi:hypothetical protein
MRDTIEHRGAVDAIVRRVAGRFGGGFPLDPDYELELKRVLLTACSSLTVLQGVASEIYMFDRLPWAREIEALARKNTPQRSGKFWDRCERGCDEGWHHFDKEIDGIPYSFVRPCTCRSGAASQGGSR